GVRSLVELDSEPCGRLDHAPTNLVGVLADSGGKHQRIEAAEHCGHSANLLGRTVDEVVHGETGRRLSASEQVPHVVAEAGDSEQTALLIKNLLDLLGREAQMLEQIQHNARVERPRPGAHAQAIKGREAHGRVNALAALE